MRLLEQVKALSESPHVQASPVYQKWADEVVSKMEAGTYSLAVKQENKGDPEDFMSEEALMALVLADAMARKAGGIMDIMDEALEENGLQKLPSQAEQASKVAGAAFTSKVADEIRAHIDSLVGKGAAKLEAGGLIGDRAKSTLIEGMVRSQKYYTNNYFNRIVMPEIFSQVEKVVDGQDGYTLSRVRETLDTRLRSVPYWRTVANSAASRSYHYGVLKGGQLSGFRMYEYVAVRDDRTTEVCLALDGQQFPVATAVNLVERGAELENVEEVAEIMPYTTDGELVSQYSNQQLSDRGLIVPPRHFNCRSTLRLVY